MSFSLLIPDLTQKLIPTLLDPPQELLGLEVAYPYRPRSRGRSMLVPAILWKSVRITWQKQRKGDFRELNSKTLPGRGRGTIGPRPFQKLVPLALIVSHHHSSFSLTASMNQHQRQGCLHRSNNFAWSSQLFWDFSAFYKKKLKTTTCTAARLCQCNAITKINSQLTNQLTVS